MAILSDFDIFAQILNSSGMPQSEHYASKSAGYCLYSIYYVVRLQYNFHAHGKSQRRVFTAIAKQHNSHSRIQSCKGQTGLWKGGRV